MDAREHLWHFQEPKPKHSISGLLALLSHQRCVTETSNKHWHFLLCQGVYLKADPNMPDCSPVAIADTRYMAVDADTLAAD